MEQDLAAAEAGLDTVALPANLRIEQFIPKRKEYSGVKSGHRELVCILLLATVHCELTYPFPPSAATPSPGSLSAEM